MISIKNLFVQRDGRDALKVESLEIKRGETLAVVGPNGAGKSTLLLTLARLINPSRGEISFQGKRLDEWDDIEYRRRIAFVFQDPLLMDLSVRENIALGLKFRGAAKSETEARVNQWMKLLGIESLAKRRAGQISGGEAQRVSLARAFVLDPELLLMDEPFAAVDPPTRTQLLRDLSKLLSRNHRTTVLVTHNMKEAVQLGDRLAVVINGELKQTGTPKQIKATPKDKSVKEFLKDL